MEQITFCKIVNGIYVSHRHGDMYSTWQADEVRVEPLENMDVGKSYRFVSDGSWVELEIDLAPIKAKLIQSIDSDVDKIYAEVIGNRGTEYAEAEREALNYKAANYMGTIPPTVQSWATVKNWTPQAAADDIMAQATAWRGAALNIRANRLKEKEAVRVATTNDEVNAAQTSWTSFKAGIRSALGLGA